MVDDRIELIDGVLGGLFQLVSELLGIDRSHLTAGGLEGEEAGIARSSDVRFV